MIRRILIFIGAMRRVNCAEPGDIGDVEMAYGDGFGIRPARRCLRLTPRYAFSQVIFDEAQRT
jgi:hypothetical protein